MSTLSYAKIVGTSCQLSFPTLSETLLANKLKLCPQEARSCFDPYDSCCIPEHGKIVLAQQWIPEIPSNIFHIHGFWPGHCETQNHPEGLCPKSSVGRSLDYLVNKGTKKALKNNLNMYWPTGKTDWDKPSFWAYQWNKHGVCLSTVQATCFDEYNDEQAVERYFGIALNEYFNYDVMRAFYRLSVDPGNLYHIEHVTEALKSWTNYSLRCDNGKLVEIRFYFLAGSYNKFYPMPPTNPGSCGRWIEFPRKIGSSSPSSAQGKDPIESPLAENNYRNARIGEL